MGIDPDLFLEPVPEKPMRPSLLLIQAEKPAALFALLAGAWIWAFPETKGRVLTER